jgi:hypothetical protein
VNDTTPERFPRTTPLMLGAGGLLAATNDVDADDAALSPVEFVATAVHVYVLPLVSEPTVIGDVAPDADCVVPPSLETHVAVNPVTAVLPAALAVMATIAELLPRVTPVTDGASGTVPGANDADATDAELSPIALVAMTVHVYVLVLVRELTVIGEVAPLADWVAPPLLDVQVAVKPVIALPPLPFALNATVAEVLPLVTPVIAGAGGLDAATNDDEADDAVLSPIALVATAAHVYVLPLLSEPTVIGEVAPDADCVVPPSLDAHVAVKPVIALPPVPFAVNATIAEFCPRVTPVSDGATGGVPATNDAEAPDAVLSAIELLAMTLQV